MNRMVLNDPRQTPNKKGLKDTGKGWDWDGDGGR